MVSVNRTIEAGPGRASSARRPATVVTSSMAASPPRVPNRRA